MTARLSRQIEWVGQLVLLMATPLLLTEGRQTLTRYKAMVRASQHPVIPAFPPMEKKKFMLLLFRHMESDEDLVENMPLQWLAIEPPQQEECQVSEVGPSPKEEEEAEVMHPLKRPTSSDRPG